MFKRVLKALFSSLSNQEKTTSPQTTSYNTNIQVEPKVSIPTKPTSLKADTPLYPHDADFLDYLFGETQLVAEADPFSDFIAAQIERLLLSPKALLNELPVMPASVTTLMAELKSDEFNVNALLKVIESEPSMAADVIKLANSARYRRSEKEVTDLKTAFMNIGSKGLIEGVIEAYLKGFAPNLSIYWRQFGEKIWQHSNQTALFAKELVHGDQLGQDQATAYFVGLIRDLGKMIIFQVMIEAFHHVDPTVPPNSSAFKKLINSYSIRLTYTIAKYWEMPEPVLKAIAYQASPNYKSTPLAQAVFEANFLSELQCLLLSKRIDEEEFQKRYHENLTTPRARQFAVKMLEDFEGNN